MPRTSSRSNNQRRTAQQRIHDLTKAALECKSLGHEWTEDPSADWHAPRYDYIRCYRMYFRCERGCGSVKVVVRDEHGRFVTGFSRPPEAMRITGLGRGAGTAPFWQEYIERRQVTPNGKARSVGRDKEKTRKVQTA